MVREAGSDRALVAWGLPAGSPALLQWAGQLAHSTYVRFGFREVKVLRDERLVHHVADIDPAGLTEDPTTLRVMLLAERSRLGF